MHSRASGAKLVATVFQDARGRGAGAIEVAAKLAKGESVPKTTFSSLVTRKTSRCRSKAVGGAGVVAVPRIFSLTPFAVVANYGIFASAYFHVARSARRMRGAAMTASWRSEYGGEFVLGGEAEAAGEHGR